MAYTIANINGSKTDRIHYKKQNEIFANRGILSSIIEISAITNRDSFSVSSQIQVSGRVSVKLYTKFPNTKKQDQIN